MAFEPFVVAPELWLVDTALYQADRHVLVLADLHLGYEAALRRAGVLVPKTHAAGLQARLRETFALLAVAPGRPLARLILNGDLRHGFGPLSRQEHRELEDCLDFLAPHARALVVVTGNHDPRLDFLEKTFPTLQVVRAWREGSWLYVHGDRLPELTPQDAHLVIGHEHPALSLRDPVTGRQERYKAFLKGHFRGRELWVLPSVHALVQGTDLAREEALSPLVREAGPATFEVFLRDDRGHIYAFGPLGRLL